MENLATWVISGATLVPIVVMPIITNLTSENISLQDKIYNVSGNDNKMTVKYNWDPILVTF